METSDAMASPYGPGWLLSQPLKLSPGLKCTKAWSDSLGVWIKLESKSNLVPGSYGTNPGLGRWHRVLTSSCVCSDHFRCSWYWFRLMWMQSSLMELSREWQMRHRHIRGRLPALSPTEEICRNTPLLIFHGPPFTARAEFALAFPVPMEWLQKVVKCKEGHPLF